MLSYLLVQLHPVTLKYFYVLYRTCRARSASILAVGFLGGTTNPDERLPNLFGVSGGGGAGRRWEESGLACVPFLAVASYA
eukprot:1394757-Amorphochlora_amoeboformis.AAC.1